MTPRLVQPVHGLDDRFLHLLGLLDRGVCRQCSPLAQGLLQIPQTLTELLCCILNGGTTATCQQHQRENCNTQ